MMVNTCLSHPFTYHSSSLINLSFDLLNVCILKWEASLFFPRWPVHHMLPTTHCLFPLKTFTINSFSHNLTSVWYISRSFQVNTTKICLYYLQMEVVLYVLLMKMLCNIYVSMGYECDRMACNWSMNCTEPERNNDSWWQMSQYILKTLNC